jgi:hypothetical protein
MPPPDHKRRQPRIQPFVAPCRYHVGEQHAAAFLTDISTTGGRIHTDLTPPPVGSAVEVRARLGRQATHLLLPGTVRWSSAAERGGFVFGMSFERISGEDARALEAVVEEFHRRAAALE